MKVVAYTALLYGKEYLSYSIRSVIDHVDQYWILYSMGGGSHGSRTSIPCPDTRDELYALAEDAAGGKLRWVDGVWNAENEQRDSIHKLVPDADVVVVLDADEIWATGLLDYALAEIWKPEYAHVNRWRVPMIHYFRSLHRAVLHDPAYPERIILPKRPKHIETLSGAPHPIHHCGYAQRSELVRWKQLTHGHRAEWRRDIDWFNEVFMMNRQYDAHPVGSEYWQVKTVDPLEYGMPEYMQGHPYWNLEVIP